MASSASTLQYIMLSADFPQFPDGLDRTDFIVADIFVYRATQRVWLSLAAILFGRLCGLSDDMKRDKRGNQFPLIL